LKLMHPGNPGGFRGGPFEKGRKRFDIPEWLVPR